MLEKRVVYHHKAYVIAIPPQSLHCGQIELCKIYKVIFSKLENGEGRITHVGAGCNAMLYGKQFFMRFKLDFCIENDSIMNK